MTIVEALIDLQEVDGRIRDLELMLKDLPRRRALETARLTEVSANLLAAKECQNQVERRAKSYEEDFMALEEKIQDLKKRQAMSKTNKEYQQYSIQIDLVTHERDAAGNNHDATMDNLPRSESARRSRSMIPPRAMLTHTARKSMSASLPLRRSLRPRRNFALRNLNKLPILSLSFTMSAFVRSVGLSLFL